MYREEAIVFPCSGENLLAIVAQPEAMKETGVLIVVGGPQYRIGSHRQFLLLSRFLAEAGYPVMRFDYRGMGDSTGDQCDFQQVSEDIGAAIDAFLSKVPGIDKVVLWGLCDAASAALLYLDQRDDRRVSGLILLNPWVRSAATLARAHIKHYYAQRLMKLEFWGKLLTGKLNAFRAMGGFVKSLAAFRGQKIGVAGRTTLSFQERMLSGLKKAQTPILLILSEDDYVAKEFLEVVRLDQEWQFASARDTVQQVTIPDADHTFSCAAWRHLVEQTSQRWLDATFKE